MSIDGVRGICHGEGRDYLESLCMKLPEQDCLPVLDSPAHYCGEHEFSCGDGQCIETLVHWDSSCLWLQVWLSQWPGWGELVSHSQLSVLWLPSSYSWPFLLH